MFLNFYRCIIALHLFLTFGHCFKIHFEHEDTWEDDDVMKDAKFQKFQLIFPGTKWCGSGNIAEHPEDLGSSLETDMCCRDHDLCADIIEAGQTNHNLTNESFYTRLNCKCDEMFYDCLKSSSKRTSKIIGNIYFNVLGTKCFRQDYPIVKCVRYHSIIKHRCVLYELDETKPPIYEWFDVAPF